MKTLIKLGIRLEDKKTDFFAAGIDSLKAIRMRGSIIEKINLGDRQTVEVVGKHPGSSPSLLMPG